MPSSTVLVATDLTARSDRPLDRAALLADQIGAGVTVAHVIEGPGFERDGSAAAPGPPDRGTALRVGGS